MKRPFILKYAKLGETLKNFAEVIALAMAAMWALFVFSVQECPKLERNLEVGADLTWSQSGGRCKAVLIVNIANGGGATVDLESIAVHGWTFPNNDSSAAVAFFNEAEIQNKQPIPGTKCDADDCLIATHYPLGKKAHTTYTWTFPPDRTRSVYYKVEVKAERIPRTLVASAWDSLCGSQ